MNALSIETLWRLWDTIVIFFKIDVKIIKTKMDRGKIKIRNLCSYFQSKFARVQVKLESCFPRRTQYPPKGETKQR